MSDIQAVTMEMIHGGITKVIEYVERHRQPLVVLRYNKPVAAFVPPDREEDLKGYTHQEAVSPNDAKIFFSQFILPSTMEKTGYFSVVQNGVTKAYITPVGALPALRDWMDLWPNEVDRWRNFAF